MNKILVIVDVQNDFANEKGALSVKDAKNIYRPIEIMIAWAFENGVQIVLTQDFHPPDHCSFSENGGVWPKHCVENEWGSNFSDELLVILNGYNVNPIIIEKGKNRSEEQYSGVTPELIKILRDYEIEEAVICGLATDFCVLETAKDLTHYVEFTTVVFDGCQHVFDSNMHKTIFEMLNYGINMEISSNYEL